MIKQFHEELSYLKRIKVELADALKELDNAVDGYEGKCIIDSRVDRRV